MLGIKTVRRQPIFTVFGNRVVQGADNQFYILATGEPYNAETHKNLVCPKCGEKPTADGHDPCIANLPSVEFACCGHGIQRGYVTFTDGRSLYGIFSHMLEQVTREELKAKSKEPGFDPYKYEVIP